MLRSTPLSLKNPIVLQFGEGLVTTQLKHILEKKPLHYMEWDDIPEYPARKLRHTDRQLDPRTGKAIAHPARDNNNGPGNNNNNSTTQYLVPDQHFHRIPVPHRYRDAYWWRERQARRIQCPVKWVQYRFDDPKTRDMYNYMDMSFEKKFWFTTDDVVEHAKQERR